MQFWPKILRGIQNLWGIPSPPQKKNQGWGFPLQSVQFLEIAPMTAMGMFL